MDNDQNSSPINSMPAPKPQAAPMIPTMARPIKKSGIGILIKIVILVVVLSLIGVGLVLATRIWDPIWSPFRPNPDKIIDEMMVKSKELKSLHSDGKINIILPKPENKRIAIIFSGDSELSSDILNSKSLFDFDLSIKETNPQDDVSLKIKTIIIGQENYFNFVDINAESLLPMLSMFNIDINKIKGNWIQSPAADNQQYNSELYEKIKNMVQESKIYAVKEQLPDETIGGQKVYHYLVAIDNEKLIKLIGDIIDESIKQTSQTEQGGEFSLSFVSGAAKGVVSELLNKIGEIDFDLFIGKKDKMIYKCEITKSIDLSKLNSKISGKISFDADINNSNFNQIVGIQAPQEFKKFEEIFPFLQNELNPKTTLPAAKKNYPAR